MKAKTYQWILLALLSAAFFFHQADRAIFGLLTIPIQDELGLTDVQIGWINTVLSWTLGGMAFIVGPICDRFSRKWIITLSLLAWSLMTFMMGFVGDWRVCGIAIPVFFVVMFFRSIVAECPVALCRRNRLFPQDAVCLVCNGRVCGNRFRKQRLSLLGTESVGIFGLFAFFVGGVSGVFMGWLSQNFGVRGFEVGFLVMGLFYLAGALVMMISFFITFNRDRISE